MARPSGWDVLGLDGDPTPGVVESVQALAKEFGDFAHDVEAACRSLNGFGSDTAAMKWVGQTADSFKGKYGPLPGRLQKLYTSYSEAADALAAYAPLLQAAQTKADSALRQAQDAHAELQRATTNANTAAADLKTAQQNQTATPNQQAVTDAQTAHDTAQTTLNNAKAQMAALTKQANDAYNDRIAAAKACASALHHAQSDGIHNKSWWQHVAEDLSKWGGEIAEIAGELAPILDIIALATAWIPGVDVVTAALAEIDNIVAIAGSVMQVAGDAMQGHWGDALLGAGMLALTFAGGRVLGKAGEEAEGAEESLGNEAREAEGNMNSVCESDPVDVVSGQMLTRETDLDLDGVLPVVLRRAYASGYRTGRLFGPGWASTLDQRISINEAGIHFAGDDAQRLDYPVPAGEQAVLPARGARWPLVWDRVTDEIRITDPWSGQTRHFAVVHHSEQAGQIRDLTAISDRNGNRIVIARDEQGTPVGVEHSGYRIAVDSEQTAGGPRITALRLLDGSEHGVTVRGYQYDPAGRLTGVVNFSGLAYDYEYGHADRIVAWTDRVGYRYTYEYDGLGRVVRTAGDDGFMRGSFAYDEAGRTTVFTDSLGRTTTYRYDEYGHVALVTDALGHSVATEYDRHGRLLRRLDATGAQSVVERDEHGDAYRITAPDGAITELAYNDLHQVLAARMPDGTVWRREYDERGNLVSVTDPLGARTVYAHSDAGALVGVEDPCDVTIRWQCDAAGLAVAATDGAGAVSRLERDAFGRVTAVTDPLGARTEYSWNAEGMPTSQLLPDGARTVWEYDAEAQLVAITDPAGARTLFEPGPFGLITARTGPDGVRHTFTYDSELRLTAVANPTGATWEYRWDAVGRLVGETDFAGRSLAYAYDPAGRLVARNTRLGEQIALERDRAGRVVARHTPEGTHTYGYDPRGRLIAAGGPGATVEFVRDAAGRVLSETVGGRTTGHAYNASGQRVRRVTWSGAESQWDYDATGRPSVLRAGRGRLDFGYDGAGRQVERILGPNARLLQDFDTTGRPVAQHLLTGQATAAPSRDAETVALERSWSWRADGVPLTLHDSLRGSVTYDADAAGRVTGVTGRSWQETYAYDAFGNVASAFTSAGQDGDTEGPRETDGTSIRVAGRTSYEYDGAGRLVRSVRRTLDGRRKVWQYAWDSEDRLVRVVGPDGADWRYSYDALGRRIGKHRTAADGTIGDRVLFVWDGPRLAEQLRSRPDGHTDALVWDYEPGSFRPAAQRRITVAPGADQQVIDEVFHAIVTDLVGAPTELVAADGSIAWRTATSLWGQGTTVASEPGADCPLRFPGQYHDAETGLHYNLHRYYDPETAAYLTPDPLGLTPAPNDRAYVPNPLTHLDPLGLSCVSVTKSENSITISHEPSGSGVIADLDENGNLTLMMDNHPELGSPLRGKGMFADVMDHFGDRVKSVQGYWRYGDNLGAFNEAVANGQSLRDAARGTWTAQRAAEYGFTRVKILQADEGADGFQVVSALFRRE